tara:strand:- start:274 stop:582 length:309 start_codon:yes stop_codon:yes gene_type:complete
MEERIFDANVSSSGKSLIVTIPKATCQILSLNENKFVQIGIKSVNITQKETQEDFRTFDANVSSSGKSLITTIPKATCQILSLNEGDFVQIKVKAVKVKPRK